MAAPEPARHRVSAVVLAFNRRDAVAEVLGHLDKLPAVDEVLVVDNGSEDDTAELVSSWGGKVRLVDAGGNAGIAGRNLGAREATGDLVVFLDDDSYPLPGAVEALTALFDRVPRLAVAGGLVRDVDPDKRVVLDTQVGTFDWWLRGGATGDPPAEGFPAFFFPEGACMVRRAAFLEVGGFYEPFFFASVEIDLATRLLSRGWDVRYLPTAPFDHMKVGTGRKPVHDVLALRVRNQLWYFWRHFPTGLAVRRMLAYAAFDLFNVVHRGALGSWRRGVVDAWRQRHLVGADRNPLPREVLHRAEGRRGRMHAQLLVIRVRERLAKRRA